MISHVMIYVVPIKQEKEVKEVRKRKVKETKRGSGRYMLPKKA